MWNCRINAVLMARGKILRDEVPRNDAGHLGECPSAGRSKWSTPTDGTRPGIDNAPARTDGQHGWPSIVPRHVTAQRRSCGTTTVTRAVALSIDAFVQVTVIEYTRAPPRPPRSARN